MDLHLLCAERLSYENGCAIKDSVIFEDNRVLPDLLQLETSYMPSCNYFSQVQTEVEPFMRKTVTKWMLEVCEVLNCEDQVFPLAVNMFDRFLCVCDTPKKFLQLLAADCILAASKIRQSVPISIDTLCYYTNHSVTPCQMRKYELLLMSKLDWDLSSTTAFDFIDHILELIKWSKRNNTIRRHSLSLVHLVYTEVEFMEFKPSLIATCCIVSAMNGLKLKLESEVLRNICNLIGTNTERIEEIVKLIDHLVAQEASKLNNDEDNDDTLKHNKLNNEKNYEYNSCKSSATTQYQY